MPSPYQDFAQKARERFLERQKKLASGVGEYQFTMHAQYKMQQYGLSEQKVKSVIRNPKRREEGIVKNTVAVMQPPSIKRDAKGGETWTQEIWVMYVLKKNQESGIRNQEKKRKESHDSQFLIHDSANRKIRIISAWRYPGVSPKRNPIPEDILLELERDDVWEG